MSALLLILLVGLVRVLLGGFLVMLVAGMLHLNVESVVPHWSYVQSMYVSIALTLIGSYFYDTNTT